MVYEFGAIVILGSIPGPNNTDSDSVENRTSNWAAHKNGQDETWTIEQEQSTIPYRLNKSFSSKSTQVYPNRLTPETLW